MPISFKSLAKGLPAKSSLAAAFASILLVGCSSSIDRFADYPGKKDEPARTASVSSTSSSDDSIQSAPLGAAKAPSTNPYQPPVYGQSSTYMQSAYRPQGNYQPPYRPQSVYDQPARRAPSVYQQQANYQPPAYQEQANYQPPAYSAPSRTGSVVVEPGQTLYSIARANGVSVAALASVNGIRAPYTLKTGQTLHLPGGGEPRAEAAYAPAGQNFSQRSAVHAVESGDTLYSLGRRYNVHPYAIADLNALPHDVALRVGQRIRIPASATSRAAVESTAIKNDGGETMTADEGSIASGGGNEKHQQRIADEQYDTGNTSYSQDGSVDGSATVTSDQAQGTQVGEALPAFRWPVKGRVISGYGVKPGGARNEGINIAVPEGTSIRASEDGVVAYAGNELKGYGNLVLIRHQGGWVTAYAHNRDLFVRRGDTVRRGDVIAKAGQTGSVESPQLHFELRKGSTAVDPMKYLQGSQTASN